MAKDKKVVLLYCDIIHTVNQLEDDQAGKLFKHYLAYINDLNPEPPDKLTQIVFEPIKQTLKRDLKKWEGKSRAATASANKRWHATASERTKGNANDAVRDKVIVKDTVIVTDIHFNNIKANFFNDFRWKEKFCRDKKIGQSDLEKKMTEFLNDIELKEDFKALKELKSHFTNLFNKQANGTYKKDISELSGPPLKRL